MEHGFWRAQKIIDYKELLEKYNRAVLWSAWLGVRLKPKRKMKEIGIAYFNWGWLITCAITAYLGWLSAERRNPKILWAACIFALVLGGLMLWAKHA